MSPALPQLTTLTQVGVQLTAAVEIELRGNLTFLEVYRALRGGDLLEEIERIAPGACDFGVCPRGSAQRAALHEALRRAADTAEGRERRKLGLISSGVHLALALVLEAIQQCYWIAPRVSLHGSADAR
ncbi:hypothetical protein J5226_01650 [Lysobacter sp. K5869]|uniref:hypothetical protein n=1 Tax=Lysobacter sp. K5869 TaxID=2820808 RepID=UPI001C0618AC|nr:hypothetical protein [Lysobacter sp. K5869]QWP77137.1 hypothetical protein J5226_01650 [Lysobacter sp. K5869]